VAGRAGARQHVGAPPAAGARAEELAEAVAEDVAEAPHAGPAGPRMGIDAGVAELVVGGTLARVRQDLVRLLRLLEALFGLGIVRIAVRMPFHRQPAIGLLDFFFGGVPVYAENLIVVALGQRLIPSSCPSLR